MSLSTYAEEFDSASHNSRPALWRGLRIKKGRNVKKKRCMLTDSLRTRFTEHWQQKAGRKAAGARTFEGHHFQSTKVLLTGKGFDHTCS